MVGVHRGQPQVLREEELSAGTSRFSRQIRFAPLGEEGQGRLAAGRVLLVGVGALGTHVAAALVRAGIGTLWLVDRDIVELDNLQRQLLFTEDDAAHGRPKAVVAAERLRHIHGGCALRAWTDDFDLDVYGALPARPDVVVDGTDNFATRYLINDLAVRDGLPWVYAGAVGSCGTAMAVLPGTTPCLRCLLPETRPTGEFDTCETAGVLAPAIAMVAAFQSAQVLKLLAGHRDDVARGVLEVDVWRDRYGLRLRDSAPRPDCPACGTGELPALRHRRREPARMCGRNAVQVQPGAGTRVDLEQLAGRLRAIATDLELTPHLLRFTVEDCRFSVFRGGRALLFGVDEPRRARILYDRYVGA